ncbi:carbamoyl-phosphate synthase large subunit [Weissella tructae]|uniref:Carbamoyl-phosphate synthase (Glutamine-hydrolyzing) n=2 Tax=Weissella TaxID=46255 RepID=A0A075TZQ5_9LACO|nr:MULTISPECIES: carbamoyl phosphate synthase large subunit [Weissella]AIG65805.1 Carbamoyl-phosphate synthase (glutamine-hydrolyzing) [Weissella tructae]AIM63184.1 Carbamoyl-phosphate synthase (glutamine-hydrolyzing) [Weissella ceti]AIM64519.1 Carbamoyl-phosphate synthase (glutamine-hydrolyzing) [Weissella ceti]ELA06743.1 carbamoyl-phosphate synthase large subunit [Weissella ceti NC36]QVV90964.1 carbamoyl-phosphate synthase large subunit [Weissella tructae]
MNERILLIGSSADGFGRATESDVASCEMIDELLRREYAVYYIDDNPYSFAATHTGIKFIVSELTTDKLVKIIIEEGITAIAPTVGGMTAINLTTDIVKVLGEQSPRVLGPSLAVMEAAQNSKYLQERLAKLGLPYIQTRIASTPSEVFDVARELDFPVVVRPVAPRGVSTRLQAEDAAELDHVAEVCLEQSLTHQVSIDKSIYGYREIDLLVMRDARDTTLLIGGTEDLDPFGIHSGDSIAITPVQTLSDPAFQTLREAAFRVARGFDVEGVLEVRFAIQPEEDEFVITRVIPFFARKTSIITAATGYPLIPVMTGVMLGERLDKIQISDVYAEHTALLEPTMDHVAIRFPVFAFRELENANLLTANRLDTIQKSVGTTIGVGRSVEEALEKAIRAAHFNNLSFSPTIMNALTDNQIIEQLLHPRDNRILLLLEALRRGYTVDELVELTKIDAFYFYKLENIMKLEQEIPKSPWDAETLRAAKYYGLSDGLVARLWETSYEEVRRFRLENEILPTYKAFEPSAGEFEEAVTQYYSTFEFENESEQLGDDSALVIGTGAFRLGDGGAAAYMMASVADEIKKQGIKTILMNNNPHDLMFMPELSDKRYFEPLEMSDIMNVVDIEKPSRIFVPGNRIKLIRSLKEAGLNVHVIPRDKYSTTTLPVEAEKQLLNYYYDGEKLYPIGISRQTNAGIIFEPKDQALICDMPLPDVALVSPGLYQAEVEDVNDCVQLEAGSILPMPFTHVAFLEKVTGIGFVRLSVRAMLGKTTVEDEALLRQLPAVNWYHKGGKLTYVDEEMNVHLQLQHALDNGRFALGARYEVFD